MAMRSKCLVHASGWHGSGAVFGRACLAGGVLGLIRLADAFFWCSPMVQEMGSFCCAPIRLWRGQHWFG